MVSLVTLKAGDVVSSDSHDDGLIKEIEKIPGFELLDVSAVRDGVHKDQPKFRAVVEKGKDEAIAVVSSKYSLVQMREIFGQVLSRIDQDIDGEVLYYGGRGQLHVFPEDSRVGICVVNSVDRSSAIKIFFIGKTNGTTVYLPEGGEYKRLHVGTPLNEVRNFSEILADAQEAWTTVAERLSKIPLTDELATEVKEAVDTKTLVDCVDEFINNNLNRHLGKQPTLWDLLLVVLKTAAGSKFKSELHRERRLRRLSHMLLAYALKEG